MKAHPFVHFVSAVVFAAAFSGCASSSVEPVRTQAAGKKIEPKASIYIATPADGSLAGKKYAGSGASVASAFDVAFSRTIENVIVGPTAEASDAAIAAAHAKGCSYVVLPRITRWEDRATEWSGRPDRIALLVKIYRVSDGSLVSSSEVSAKSSWATLGGDHPDQLIKKPIEEFVRGLY